MSHYIAYYENQAGGGAVERYNRFSHVYVGAPDQRGHGIGAFLGGLFRRIMPLFGRAARAVGKEALHTGMNIVGDVANRQVPLRDALENRLTESGLRLKRKAEDKFDQFMNGSGYKRQRIAGTVHKVSSRRPSRTHSTKKKKAQRFQRKKNNPRKKNIKKNIKKKRPTKKNKKKSTRDVYDIFN